MQPDIIARVTMFTPDAGGKASGIPATRYGCPLFIENQGFDCRLLLDQVHHGLTPGNTAEVPIKFLYFDLVRPLLSPGVRFTLWEMRHFAEGEILQVCRST
ncbi:MULTISPECIES: hypothetical protein [unclassified Cupriavidus]|uniref:hypothetical protein n=1 Tax=Cupriavidus sp. H19C3 TaxID=3241603 RepID=UPI003BF8D7F5